MRISDWSSDVCSSDLLIHAVDQRPVEIEEEGIAYHRAGPRHAIPLLRRGCSAEVGDEILRLSGDGFNAVAGAVERGAEPEDVGARLATRPHRGDRKRVV